MPPCDHASSPVCVVDDDPSVLGSIRQLLESDDLPAETFDHPGRLLAYVNEQAVAVAVVDLWMPEMSGMDVLERLRASSPRTRVIIITGRDAPEARANALAAGAVAFLTKPFGDEEFLAAVRRALKAAAATPP